MHAITITASVSVSNQSALLRQRVLAYDLSLPFHVQQVLQHHCAIHLGKSHWESRIPTGAHNRTRTDDLFLTKEVLYHLSYVSLLERLNRYLISIAHRFSGAGSGNRTRAISLEG